MKSDFFALEGNENSDVVLKFKVFLIIKGKIKLGELFNEQKRIQIAILFPSILAIV